MSQIRERWPPQGLPRPHFEGRYISGLNKLVNGALNVTVNVVHIYPLDYLTRTLTIDSLCYVNSSTIAGNYIIGLYGPGTPNTDVPDGATLLYESGAAVTVNGLNEQVMTTPYQFILDQDRVRVPGWIAVVFNNAANSLFNVAGTDSIGSATVLSRAYNAGAFDILDPCPATVVTSIASIVKARILSIP